MYKTGYRVKCMKEKIKYLLKNNSNSMYKTVYIC